MIIIRMFNTGGELDKREAKTVRLAAEVLAEMVRDCSEIYPGDRFEVAGEEEQ